MSTQVSKSAGLWPPLLPREHGAWAMLLVPLVVGALAGGRLTIPVALTVTAVFFAYLARQPLTLLARAQGRRQRVPLSAPFWFAVYGSIAGLSALLLLLVYGFWLLAPLAALGACLLLAHLLLARRRAEMTVWGEMLGIAALALGGPAVYYVATGAVDREALGLWLLPLLYFGGAVFYVRLRVRVQTRHAPPQGMAARLWAGRSTVLFHVLALGLTALLVGGGLLPLLAPLAYLPATCKAFQGSVAWPRAVNIKRLGILEFVHSFIFVLILLIAYR